MTCNCNHFPCRHETEKAAADAMMRGKRDARRLQRKVAMEVQSRINSLHTTRLLLKKIKKP